MLTCKNSFPNKIKFAKQEQDFVLNSRVKYDFVPLNIVISFYQLLCLCEQVVVNSEKCS